MDALDGFVSDGKFALLMVIDSDLGNRLVVVMHDILCTLNIYNYIYIYLFIYLFIGYNQACKLGSYYHHGPYYQPQYDSSHCEEHVNTNRRLHRILSDAQ